MLFVLLTHELHPESYMGETCGYGVPPEGQCFDIVRFCRVMQNSDPEGKIFLSAPNSHGLIFVFLA